jgi:CubicO group peptidase (beta-lactamase class C family)
VIDPVRVRRWMAAPALLAVAIGTAAADDGAWIEAQRAHWQVPGVVVAIVDGARPPQTYSAGLCHVERHRTCSARSQFAIASNTKFATGLLAAVLAEKGVLQLDTPLAEDWPDVALDDGRTSQLTLRDLLSQRSGLGSVDWPYFWDARLRRDDYLARLRHVPFMAPPRERWHYANANYVLAGAWIERVTGRDWRRLLREHLLRPLRMKDAGFGLPGDGTRGYTRSGDAITPAVAWTAEALAPAGSLVLSARDWTRLLAAVVAPGPAGDTPLPRQAIAAVLEPQTANTPDARLVDGPGGYALGLFSATYREDAIRYHIGRTTGFTSAVLLLPQRSLAIAVMANIDNTDFPAALAFALADRRLGRPGEPTLQRWRDLRGSSADEDAAVGESDAASGPTLRSGGYHHPAWGRFVIAQGADGTLRIRMGRLDAPLRRAGEDSLTFEPASGWPPLRLHVHDDGDGFSLDDGASGVAARFVRVTGPDA